MLQRDELCDRLAGQSCLMHNLKIYLQQKNVLSDKRYERRLAK